MKPRFDALVFCGWHWGETSGTATVLRNLVGTLPDCFDIPIHLAVPEKIASSQGPRLGIPGRVQFHRIQEGEEDHRAWLRSFATRGARIEGVERPLLFFPSMHLPEGMDHPFVSILHDVLPLHQWSHRLNPFRRRAYLREIQRHRRAEKVFTVSRFAARDICGQTGWSPGHVIPILNGVGAEFSQAGKARGDGNNPPHARPYIFYAGDLRKRKNFMALAKAYALLSPALRERFDLVFTGDGPPLKGILSFFKTHQLESRVLSLGKIGQGELPQWMAGASLFVFPSLQEGFGLPVAEAQCAGVPVVCGTNSSLPEVSGGHAAFANVGNHRDLARVMEKMLDDLPYRDKILEGASAHASGHSWERAARQYAEALAAIMETV